MAGLSVQEMFKDDSFSQMRAVHPVYMIDYLQSQLDRFMVEKEQYGAEDRIVKKKLDELISCKEMVEALIGKPVNLNVSGTVTVG